MGTRHKSLRSLGSDYISDFFRGAMFHDKENNRVLRMSTCSNGVAICSALSLEGEPAMTGWSGNRHSVDLFATDGGTFSMFSWPRLGYRNVMHGTLGNIVYNLHSERGTGRGLRDESVIRTRMPVYSSLMDYYPNSSTLFDASNAARAHAIYKPTWYTYREGMQRLKAGEWVAFALNEDIAISLAHETPNNEGFDIYFRNNLAGTVSEEGHIMMRNKTLTRASLQKLLNKEA